MVKRLKLTSTYSGKVLSDELSYLRNSTISIHMLNSYLNLFKLVSLEAETTKRAIGEDY